MTKTLVRNLKARRNVIPSCKEYKDLLDYASEKTGKSRYELFENQVFATYAEWADYLNKIGHPIA